MEGGTGTSPGETGEITVTITAGHSALCWVAIQTLIQNKMGGTLLALRINAASIRINKVMLLGRVSEGLDTRCQSSDSILKLGLFFSSLVTVLSTQTNSRLISVNILAVFVTSPELINTSRFAV